MLRCHVLQGWEGEEGSVALPCATRLGERGGKCCVAMCYKVGRERREVLRCHVLQGWEGEEGSVALPCATRLGGRGGKCCFAMCYKVGRERREVLLCHVLQGWEGEEGSVALPCATRLGERGGKCCFAMCYKVGRERREVLLCHVLVYPLYTCAFGVIKWVWLMCPWLYGTIPFRFLEVQIQETGGKEVRCPAFGCFKVVPNVSIQVYVC